MSSSSRTSYRTNRPSHTCQHEQFANRGRYQILASRLGRSGELKNKILLDPRFFLRSLVLVSFFGFIDGSYWETCTPGTGPHGDYERAQRHPDWYLIQRAVYSGYKRIHGLLLLTVMLPNGITFLFGPGSARRNDRGLVNMSGLDDFLGDTQSNRFPGGIEYALYGDGSVPRIPMHRMQAHRRHWSSSHCSAGA